MAEKRVLGDLFLRDKPAKILNGLKVTKGFVYATILSKEADCTYSHTIKILDTFLKAGIVKFEKKGRIKRVTLTDGGWELAKNMEAFQKVLDQLEDGVTKKGRKK